MEYASTAYRQVVSDIYNGAGRGDLFCLLDHADGTMRFVKTASKDPNKAGKMLRHLKGEKTDDE